MNICKPVFFATSLFAGTVFAQTPMEKFEFVNFSQVNITDNFWKPKIDMVATVTLKACIYQTETTTPRIRNFEKVARKKGEKHEGIYYDDSDVYKALEAMAYSLERILILHWKKRQMNGSIKSLLHNCPMVTWILILH